MLEAKEVILHDHAKTFPTPKKEITECPPPTSTYCFQKLACENFAHGACEQYGLPYTIIRPSNRVGTGERRALGEREIASGKVKLAMSHVVSDLIQKVVKGQDLPLHILGDGTQERHYTYGGDLARGDVVVTSMADLPDPPSVIPLMAAKIREEGADIVSGSCYMPGGSQTGGPRLKTLMSRAAGIGLHYVGRAPTHDATTNFRAYSRRFLEDVAVESVRRFEVDPELTTKAHLLGYRVDEIPITWPDRAVGTSKFDLVGCPPAYPHWYWLAVGGPVLRWAGGSLAALAAMRLLRLHRRGDRGPTRTRETLWPK